MKAIVRDLAEDFKRWGKTQTQQIQEQTRKHGVYFACYHDSRRGLG